MKQIYDVMVIGAGVVGCATARELARYKLKIGVLEKNLDVGMETSGRNSGVLHGGFTYKTGSLKAICCIEGNEEFDEVAKQLDVPFKRTGKVVVGFTDEHMQSLLKYKAIGEANGAKGLEIIDKKRLYELDSSAGGEFAMYSPASGILNPFIYTVALAENAHQNGAEFFFDNEVTAINRDGDIYRITTNSGEFEARWVINCAGLGSAKVSTMLGIDGYTIGGFKGEYIILDKKAGKHLNMPVYPAPNATGNFDTHATPTVDGNVLIGPDSLLLDEDNLEDYSVTQPALDGLIEDGLKMFGEVKRENFIRCFAGVRPKLINKETKQVLDFVVEARPEAPNTVNMVGIESPGLTCALPLARRAVAFIKEKESLEENTDFCPKRKGIVCFAEQSDDVKRELIEADPDYGEIVCRCECVTKAEIKQAVNNCLGAATINSIKNRTRATMGRCQGGYCETRIVKIIQQELERKETEILLSKPESYLFTGKVRNG